MIRHTAIVGQRLPERLQYVNASRSRPSSQVGTSAGFTLLELLVVVTIIGLLAAYVGPKYFSQLGKSEQGVAKAQVEAFVRALDTYRLDVGQYPTTEEGLNALLTRPGTVAKWNGPYLQKAVPLDPWGRPYLYRAPGAAGDFDIISYGKDGQPGGAGDAADVTNQ
ncbi:MAG: type II secretion system major pseudopilin GspG [Candidatus Accumulibacter similis]|nr:MAG: type II secretion system major pseudopilin GspG [Candidatus Accumulibacter similis]